VRTGHGMDWGRPRINTGYVRPETPAACGHLPRPADRRRRRAVGVGERLMKVGLPTIYSVPSQRFERFREITAEVPNVAVMPLMSWWIFLVPLRLQGAPRGSV
jgi:hypothetical protein